MREILFRGKRKDTGEWVRGGIVQNYFVDGDACIVTLHGKIHSVNPETVGQFTGLLDVEGTEIFEGDVVRNVTPNSERKFEGPVQYSGLFCNFSVNGVINLYGVVEQYRVVGNTHDNMEG